MNDNQSGIVAWFIGAKKLIKLDGITASYKLSDDVGEISLKKGDKVTYVVKDTIITSITKDESAESVKVESVKEEPKAEAPVVKEPVVDDIVDDDTKPEAQPVLTEQGTPVYIHAVSGNKRVVKFSKDEPWVNVSEELQKADYNAIGLQARNNGLAVVKDNVLISFVKVESDASKSTQDALQDTKTPVATQTASEAPKKEYTPYKKVETSNVQVSIEAQNSVTNASNMVAQIASSLVDKPPASKLIEMVRILAVANYELIQELKAK